MKNSIKNQLTAAIIVLLFVACLINAAINFFDILRETHKLQDDLLRQVADYIDPLQDPQKNLKKYKDDAALYIQTSATPAERQFIAYDYHNRDGFHSVRINGDRFRYYLRHKESGYVIVMQNNDYREELAVDVALDNSIPFLLLIPLLALAIALVIRYKMRSVQNLSKEIENRQDLDLTPINPQSMPDEIRGFVTAINKLFKRTDNLIQQQQRFIADAAHEMRSPMTALSLQAERLSAQDLPPRQAEQISIIQRSIKRNRHLIEQLLSLARAQSTTLKLHKTEIHSQTLFRHIIEELLPISQLKNQDLGVVSEKDVVFTANDSEIFTLIKTLADNALRYTPEESRIDLSCEENEQYVIFTVEDNGKGIAREERERVLEPFYRILGTQQQGTGLGFSIADSIAGRYGGHLELHDSRQFDSGLLVKIFLKKSYLQPDKSSSH